jgi:hypothetical protein
MLEVDWLGKEFGGPEVSRAPAALVIAIGRHHESPAVLDLAKQLHPVHPRHVDVRQDRKQLWLNLVVEQLESVIARVRKVQCTEVLCRASRRNHWRNSLI